MKHIIFTPIYQERIWGGRYLENKLGRSLPVNQVIGESWEIVDRLEAQSTTSEGKTLRELISEAPEAIMGSGWSPERPFPILVKWLDCREKLSLQVHPSAEIAPKLSGEPKAENWYIADAAPQATLMVGLKKGVTPEDFRAALHSNTLERLVHSITVKAGESIFIPGGRIHAIGGGNLILEIQQNSDTTYRIYDWGRVGPDGKPRDLHIEKSMQSSDFNDFEPNTLKPTGQSQTLAQSDAFNINKVCLKSGEPIRFKNGQPRILSIIKGALIETSDGSSLHHGDNALLPASHHFDYIAQEDTELLLTESFNH